MNNIIKYTSREIVAMLMIFPYCLGYIKATAPFSNNDEMTL